MEENQKRAEDLAARENKDTRYAVYDRTQNQLIDFEDIMMSDYTVVKKLKNLTEFGITEEQIKALFMMSSDFSTGASLDTALEELEKVFLVIANRLTNAPNGLVIDIATGKEDEILSRIQCNELNIEYGDFREMPVAKREDAIAELIATITESEIKSVEIDKYIDIYEDSIYSDISNSIIDDVTIDDDFKAFNEAAGVTEEEKEATERNIDLGTIKTVEDQRIVLAIFELQEMVQNGVSPEETEAKRAEIKTIIEENKASQYYEYFLTQEGDIELKYMPQFLKEWSENHTIASLTHDLGDFYKLYKDIKFEEISAKEKITIARTLAEAYISKDPSIQKYLSLNCKMFGIEPTFEAIQKLVLETTGISLESPESIKEHFNRDIDVNNFRKIEQFQLGDGSQSGLHCFKKSENLKSKRTELVYSLLNEKLQGNSDEEKALTLIALYQKYSTSKETDALTTKILGEYIKDARSYLEKYFTDVRLFHKGNININAVNRILEGAENIPDITAISEDISRVDDIFKEVSKRERDKLEGIKKIVEGIEGKIDVRAEDKLVLALSNLNGLALNDNLIETLRALGSEKINLLLEQKSESKEKFSNHEVFSIEGEQDLSIHDKEIFNIITNNLRSNDESGRDSRALEIIKLYQECSKTKGSSMSALIISKYIKSQQEYFKEYFKTYKEGTIFDEKGNIDSEKVEQILSYIKFDQSSINNIDNMRREINESARNFRNLRINEAENISILRDAINQKDCDLVLGLLDGINPAAINNKEIRMLRALKSRDINFKLDEFLSKTELIKVDLSKTGSMDLDVNREFVILMESNVDLSRGTPEYSKIIKRREEFYKENPKYREVLQEIRGEDGELTQTGKDEISNYKSNLVDEAIMKNITTKDPSKLNEKGRKNYVTLLLMATESNDINLKKEALTRLQNLYEGTVKFDFKDDIHSIASNIYSYEFGKKTSTHNFRNRMRSKREVLAKNLISNRMSQMEHETKSASEQIEYMEKKIADQEIDSLFNEYAIDLVDTAITPKESELQNCFKSSEIAFSEQEEKTFNDLYTKATVGTWLSSREDAKKYYYGNLLLTKDNLEKNPDGSLAGVYTLDIVNMEIEGFLQSNPEIQEEYKTGASIAKLKKETSKYRILKAEEEILSDFLKETDPRSTYYDIEDSKKQDYIIKIMLAKRRAEKTSNPEMKNLFSKIANRKLELMNTKDKKFISFNEKGEGIIDEALLVEEYNSTIPNYEYRSQSLSDIEKYSLEYYNSIEFQGELAGYENETKIYKKLESKTLEAQLSEIENIKLQENQQDVLNQIAVDRIMQEMGRTGNIQAEVAHETVPEYETTNGNRTVANDRDTNQDLSQEERYDAGNSNETLKVEDMSVNNEFYQKSQEDNSYENKQESFLDRVKNTINKFIQPKSADGNEEKGRISKIIDGIKNIFSKNGNQKKLPEPKGAKDMLTNNMNQYIVNQVPTISSDMLRNSSNKAVNNKGTQDNKFAEEEIEV